jgi:cytosine/uracil/thiamine/allantoin permease
MRALYDYSWFVGFAVAFVVYYAMMKVQQQTTIAPQVSA